MKVDSLTWRQKYTHVVQVTTGLRDKYGRPIRDDSVCRDVSYSPKSDSWTLCDSDVFQVSIMMPRPMILFDHVHKWEHPTMIPMAELTQIFEHDKFQAYMKQMMSASLQRDCSWQIMQRKLASSYIGTTLVHIVIPEILRPIGLD